MEVIKDTLIKIALGAAFLGLGFVATALIVGLISIFTDWTGIWYQWATIITLILVICYMFGFSILDSR